MTYFPGIFMFKIMLEWLIPSLGLFITSKLIKGFEVRSFASAMWTSLVIGALNVVLLPLLLVLTFPVNFLTLGLFTFVVNSIILRLAAGLVKNFNINGWGAAIAGAVVLSIIKMMLFWIFPIDY